MNRTILNQFSCRPTGKTCTSQVTTNASPSGPLPRTDARSMLWKLAFFVFATFLLIPGESMATHFAGGEITYRYLSGTNYEVTLRLYRDCAGVNYFNPERINITPASFGQNVLQLPQVSVQEISPICPTAASTCSGGQLNGIEERVFRTTRSFPTLPNGQVYTLSSERCCRNFVINTLTSPGGTGWYITTTLDPNLTPRNSSPVFLNPPVAFLCVNQLATINPLATDPDGDVLQYSLVPCRDNTAGFPNVNYATGFSPTNPLTTTSGLTLDAVTGQLTFTPSQLEVGVICTRVEEFRNGTKIGEVIRDIQVQVQACSNNNPVITPIANQVTAVGNQLCVPVTVTDVDGDNLTVTAASAISPPAVFIVTSSAPGLVTGLFCWTPSPGDAGNTFPVSINASDDACPLSGSSSESFNITVPIACSLGFNQIVTDETCIGSANGTIDATVIGATPPISYNWFGPNGYTAITEDITGLSGGAYTLIIVDGNNCVDSTTINVNQGSVAINYNVLTQDPDCGGGGGVITVTGISGGNPPYTYSNDGGTTTQASGTFANLAPGTYDIRVFDASGCASAIQTVTLVQQGADPLVVTCPGDTAIAADEACEAITPDFVPLVTLTGGCPPVTVEQFPFAGQPIETGVTPVVLYVRDGNSILLDSCTLNVTVFDTVAPTLSAIPNDTTVACTDIPEAASVVALDNCPNPPLFFNETITPGNCPGNYTLTRRWTTFQGSTAIRDSQIVTVVDTVAPDIICPASITVSNDPGICGAAITHQENASDACGTPTVTFAPASGSVLPLGVNTVVGTATDECGNSDTCQFTVTVNDTEAPIAGCQDITITTTSSTVPEDVTPVMINNGSTDNCGIVFTGVNPSGFVCADAGPNTVVLTIRDAAGNEDTCQATVTVIDDCCDLAVSLNSSADPTCPGGTDGSIDIDVTTSNGPSTFLWDNGATSEDLTGLAQGTYVVVVTDANNCTDSLTVTLTDTPDLTPPSLTCPTNLSLCADGFCGGTLPDFVSTAGTTQLANSSNDFAGIQGARNWLYGVADYSNGFLLNSSLLPNYTGFVWNNPGTTLDFPQLDANGGHPQFEGPRQAVRRWVSSYTGTVNLRMEFYDRDGNCGDGAHVRYFKNGQEVWQFFDIPVGAANMQVFNITETVVCGDILDFSIDPKFSADCDDTHFRIEISAANQVTASDACSGVVLTQFPAPQTPLPLGITPVTITATDAAGNTDTCQFNVAVTDQTPPVAFCQDVTINVDNNNAPVSVTATDIDSNSVDNCGIVSRTISTNSFGCADGGLHTVTLTLTDATGNFSQCTAEVNVVANCCNMVLTQAGATDPTCNGVADGTIDISTANAAAPVNYLWSDGATTEDRSGLAAGTYTVVATDANNCTDSLTVTLAAPTAIVLTLNGTDPACNGESTGSVDLTVDGGTAPYTYAWSNGATSEDLANVPAGNYDVTVTDANACFEVASITLSEPPALVVSVVGTDLACNNDGSGSIDVSVSGGVGPYTYAWGDGSTAEDRSGLDAGAYTLVVTDANGCTANGGATLTEPSAIVVTSTSTNPVCPGDADGSIDVTVSGGSAPYTYAWGDGATTEDRSNLAAGTYMVTVTDANNCTGTTSATIIDGSDAVDPVVTCPSDITVGNDPGVCEAAVAYSASATDNCGTPTVALSPASGSTFAVGTATVTATADDGNGNTASCTFTVTVNDTEAPAIVCPADVSVGNDPGLCSAVVTYPAPTATDNCPVGGPTPVSALVPGDIAFTRLKCDNPDQFAFVLLRPILSGTVINFTDNGWLAAGGFRIAEGDITWTAPSNLSEGTEIIIDNNNTANIGTVVVNTIISLASSGDQIIAFQGTLASPTLLAAVHSESATWNATAGTDNQSALPAGLVDGVTAVAIPEIDNQWYDCSTVSGTPGALGTALNTPGNWIRANSPTGYLPVSCTFNVAAGGGLTPMLVSGIGSGGTFPVGVSDEIWEVADPSGNTAQCTVRVTVTDVEPPVANCQDITITATSTTVPETFTAGQINNASTDNCGVDSVTVSPSGFTCNDAGANTVTLTVIDVNGLSSTCTATVNVVDGCCNLSLVQANTNDPSCAGFSDGQIDISSLGAIGTVSYLWSNGAVTEDLNGVPAGTYTVTATDNGAANCTATLSVTLTDPPAIAISGVPSNPLCAGDASGNIDVSVTGGTSPYTYAWSNTAVSEDLSGVAAGSYTVTVTDANNCTAVETFNLIDPAALTASAAGTDPLCAGDASGNIDVTVSGGTAPYTYSWNDGATSEDRTGVAAGTYIVTVTDANNCSTTASATLTDPAAISASATGTDPVCNGEATGSVDLTVSGGTAPYTYLWSDGSTTEDLSGVGAGTYSVTITDANNCTATASATLTDPAAITATTVGTDPVCPGNANGSVDLTVSGGTAPYTYMWSNGATTEDLSGVVAGTYTVTITDANNCTGTASATLVDGVDNVPPVANCNDVTIQLDANGDASITLADLNGGATDNCGTPTVTGGPLAFACADVGANVIVLTATDQAGNTDTCQAIVTVEDNLPPTVTCDDLTVYLDGSGQASITAADVEGGAGGQGTAIITVTITPDFFASQTGWEITDAGNNVVFNVPTGSYFDFDPGPFTQDITVPCGASYNFTISDAFQDGGPSYEIRVNGTVVVPNTVMANGVTNEMVAVPVSSCPGAGGITDNCAIQSSGIDITAFTCADAPGPVTVTLTATDVNGNSSSCTSSVTVLDSIAPVIACPANITVNNDAGNCSAVVTYNAPVGTDNCNATTVLTSGLGAGATFPVGTGTETYTVTDGAGNTATCSFDVTVVDNEPPLVNCQDLTVYLDGNGQASITAGDVEAGGGGQGTAVVTVTITPDFFASQTGWELTDGGGNVLFNVPTGSYFDFDPGPFTQDITVTCGASYSFTISDAFQDGGPMYSIAVDGNVVVPTTTMANGVTNETVAVPVSSCPGTGGTSDNCAIASTGIDISDFDCADAASPVTVTYTATDVNGNSSTCTSSVTVVDSIAPVIACPTNVTVNNDAGNCSAVVTYTAPVGTDNCPATTVLTSGLGAGATFPVGTSTETYTVTDASGNSATCSFDVTVVDNEPPAVSCTDLTVYLDGNGQASITESDVVGGGGGGGTAVLTVTITPDFFASQTGWSITDGANNTVFNLPTGSYFDFDPGPFVQNITVPCGDTYNFTISDAFQDGGPTYQIEVDGNIVVPATLMANGVTNEMAAVPVSACGGGGGITDNCAVQSSGIDITDFDCSDAPGPVTVTLTATDVNGNTATCTSAVTVLDSVAPAITCPADVTVACGSPTDPASTGMATATDNCPNPGVTFSDATAAGSCPQESVITRTWTATDASGNAVTCVQTITIEDNDPPVFSVQAADLTVECDGAGNTTALNGWLASQGGAVAADACGNVTFTNDFAGLSDDCGETGTATVTFTAADECGNTATTTATFTIEDTQDPVVSTAAADLTVECDGSGNTADLNAWLAAQAGANASDDCSNVTWSNDFTGLTNGCGETGSATVTFTATDDCGNTATTSAIFTIEDTQAPTVACPADIVTGNDAGICGAAVTYSATASDDCGTATVDFDIASGSVINVGTTTVTATGTDECGNTATCSFTVTVNDTEAPTAICQDITVTATSPTVPVVVTAAQIDNNSSDNCGVANVSLSPASFTCSDAGPNTVTLTVTDAAGNVDTCSATVTVVDDCCDLILTLNNSTDPSCPGSSDGAIDITATTSNGPVTFVWSNGATTEDLSGLSQGTYTVNATDANGCPATLTVTITDTPDNTAPVVICAADVTVNCGGDTSPAATGSATATDNCDPNPSVTFTDATAQGTCAANSVITRTWTATDASGNSATCVQTITTEDNTAPVVVCPADITVSNDPGVCEAVVTYTATATDDCGTASVTYSTMPGSSFSVGAATVTVTATDECGNTATCDFTVTVNDTEAPAIACPADITIGNDAGLCSADVTYAVPTVTDNCPAGGAGPSPISTLSAGDIAFTSMAVDNPDEFSFVLLTPVTAATQITFTDNGWFAAGGFRPGEGALTWTAGSVLAEGTEVTINNNTASIGTTSGTNLALAASGDQVLAYQGTSAAPTFIAAVHSNGADWNPDATNSTTSALPTGLTDGVNAISIPEIDNMYYDCSTTSGTAAALAAAINDESNWQGDNDRIGFSSVTCNFTVTAPTAGFAPVLVSGLGSGATFPVGTSTEVWVATDAAGNTDTCSFTITVNDTEAPVASCQDITVTANDPNIPVVVTAGQIDNNSTDNCGVASVSISPSSFTCADAGANTVTLTVTDAAGNVDTCSATVTVIDNCCDLTLTLANATDPSCPGSSDGAIDITATTSNGPVTFVWSNGATTEDLSGLSQGTYTVNATDANGCPATLTVTITDTPDSTAPVVICAADVTVNCGDDTSPAATGSATATDNCDPNPAITFSDATAAGACPQEAVITRTWVVIDASGNSATCGQIITIEDNVAPVITTQASDQTVECDGAGNTTALNGWLASQGGAAATDDCGNVTWTNNFAGLSDDCGETGTATVIFTASDECGNTSTTTATFTIEDTQAPVVSTPAADLTVECDGSGNTADLNAWLAAQAGANASDDCGNVTWSNDFTGLTNGCGETGSATVTFTATDDCGNASTTSAIFTIEDTQAPTVACPANIVTGNDAGICGAAVTYSANASDDCGTATVDFDVASGSVINVGTTTVTATATDECGNTANCSFTVTVNDTEAPTAICQDITVTATSPTVPVVVTAAQIDNNSSDNCGVASVTLSPASYTCNDAGPQTVILTVTDAAGNVDSCTATVTVVANCCDLILTLNNSTDPSCPGSSDGSIDITATTSNGPVSFVWSNGATTEDLSGLSQGTYTVNATDANGCPATLTVTITDTPDNTAPVVICAADVTVSCGDDTSPAATGSATATDNCDPNPSVSFTDATAQGTCAANSVITRTWTATDVSGNTATCVQTITTEDNTAPVVVCPADIVVNNDPGVCDANVNFTATATDDCGTATVTYSVASGSLFSLGTTTVTVTATDECGNTATCDFTVTVNDVEAPAIACPADITVGNDAGLCSAVVNYAVPTSTDNCPVGGTGPTPISTLSAGDIAMTSMAADNPDEFSFVLLTPVTAATQITFTDNGWFAAGGFRTGEGVLTWTAGSVLAEGTEVIINNNVANIGTTSGTNLALSSSGDQVLAYQGTSAAPTFIAAIHSNGTDWNPDATNTTTSALPTGLTDGVNAVSIPEIDNMFYDCSTTSGSPVALAAAINDDSNWQGANDRTGFTPAACNFNVTASSSGLTPVLVSGLGSGGTFPVGTSTEVWAVSDAAGNSDTCSFTITVNDTEAPVAICNDLTVQLDASGSATITAADVDGGSTDNCAVANVSIDNNTFDCSDVAVTPVVNDLFISEYIEGSGVNKAIEIYNGTGATVDLAAGGYSLDISFNGGSSTLNIPLTGTVADGDVYVLCDDGAGIPFLAQADQTTGSNLWNGNDAITLRRGPFTLDIFGNIGDGSNWVASSGQATANQTLRRRGTVTAGVTVDPVGTGAASFTTLGTEWDMYPQDDFADLGSHSVFSSNAPMVTLTVTDASGNQSTCTAIVTVEDNVPPTAVCQDVTLQLDASGNAVLNAGQIDGGSTDNCGIATLDVNPTAFTCADVANGAVATLTVTDVNGNSSSCTSNVSVEDNVDPTAVCEDVTIFVDGTGNASTTASAIDGGSTDNCGIQSLSLDNSGFDCSDAGRVLANGLFISEYVEGSSFEKYIEIYNGTGAAVNLADYELQLFRNGAAATTAGNSAALSGTLADGATIVYRNASATGPGTPLGTSTSGPISFNGDDAVALFNTVSGSFVDIFGVIGEDPGSRWGSTSSNRTDNRTLRRNRTVTTGISVSPAVGNGATGFTTLDTEWTQFDQNDISGLGSHAIALAAGNIVTLTVTDVSGNTDACTAVVTVLDTIDPTIACPADIVVGNDAGVCGAVVNYTVNSDDNCSGDTLSLVAGLGSGATFPVGVSTESFTVTDAAGNTASCSFTVTVNDTEDPVVVCPADIVVSNDPGVCGANVTYAVTASDNCPGETLAQTAGLGSGSLFPVGTTTEAYTATDAAGNTGSCSFTVTVNDTEDPVITCPADIVVSNDAGICGAAVNYTVNTSDNCTGETLTQNAGLGSGATFPVGVTTVSYTVTDLAGNTASCSFTVTVNDTEAPTIACPADITVSNDAGICGAVVTYSLTTSDNCAGETANLVTGLASGSTFPVGTTNVSYTATDAAGNTSAACSFTVTVEDTEDPVIVCPADIVVTAQPNDCDPAVTWTVPTPTDNCGIQSVSSSANSGDEFPVGTTTVTYTVTDVNGNTSTCSFTVTVDALPLTASCSATDVTCGGNNDGTITATPAGGCEPYTYLWDDANMQTTQTATGLGAGTYTVTVTDANGQTATSTCTVNELSPVAATIGCCQDAVIQCGDSAQIVIDLEGTGPWTLIIGDGTSTFTVTANSTPYVLEVTPTTTTTYTLLSVSAAGGCGGTVCGNATIGVNGDCPTVTCADLDFNIDSTFSAVPAGTIVDEQWAHLGVHISANNNRNNHPDEAIIFDSSNPTGGDTDLGTPNAAFGGPGVGSGGAAGQVGENAVALGNLLIIAENINDNNNDGLVDNPDDEAGGGDLIFDFDVPVHVLTLTLVDLDDASGNSIITCSNAGGVLSTIGVPNLGDNSAQTITVNTGGVTQVKVHYTGSGGVSAINFCDGDPTANNGGGQSGCEDLCVNANLIGINELANGCRQFTLEVGCDPACFGGGSGSGSYSGSGSGSGSHSASGSSSGSGSYSGSSSGSGSYSGSRSSSGSYDLDGSGSNSNSSSGSGYGSGLTSITAGSCNGCHSENTVVFNGCSSCVDVSSCKDLSNVVLLLCNGQEIKYDNLNQGKTGTFCSPNGEDILSVWVKSGCYQSGDGPGYGRRFDGPCTSQTCSSGSGSGSGFIDISVPCGTVSNVVASNGATTEIIAVDPITGITGIRVHALPGCAIGNGGNGSGSGSGSASGSGSGSGSSSGSGRCSGSSDDFDGSGSSSGSNSGSGSSSGSGHNSSSGSGHGSGGNGGNGSGTFTITYDVCPDTGSCGTDVCPPLVAIHLDGCTDYEIADDSVANICTAFTVIDFEDDANGNALAAGEEVNMQYAAQGVAISVENFRNGHPDKGIIFDSSNPTGGDNDLGSPNAAFGGPGIGAGGAAGAAGENAIALGNVLIVAENDWDGNNDGLVDNPDDEARGGEITIQFAAATTVDWVQILDLDDGTGGSVMTCTVAGGSTVTIPIPNLGDNSTHIIPLNVDNVTELKIHFAGSGALAGFAYCDPGMSKTVAEGFGTDQNEVESQQSLETFDNGPVITAYPNPFREDITFEIELNEAVETSIIITDMNGKIVRRIQPELLEAGVSKVIWNGKDDIGAPQSNGVYFARIMMGNQSEVVKVILQK